MPNCDFNKVAKQLYSKHTSAWVFSCKFAGYFQNTFYEEHLLTAASVIVYLYLQSKRCHSTYSSYYQIDDYTNSTQSSRKLI